MLNLLISLHAVILEQLLKLSFHVLSLFESLFLPGESNLLKKYNNHGMCIQPLIAYKLDLRDSTTATPSGHLTD